MKFAGMYLIGFVVLIAGVLAAMWKLGILQDIGAAWTVGIGIMFSVSKSGSKENIEIDNK